MVSYCLEIPQISGDESALLPVISSSLLLLNMFIQ